MLFRSCSRLCQPEVFKWQQPPKRKDYGPPVLATLLGLSLVGGFTSLFVWPLLAFHYLRAKQLLPKDEQCW